MRPSGRNRWRATVALVAVVVLAVAVGGVSSAGGRAPAAPVSLAATTVAALPAAAQEGDEEWTVLVYLAADNDLEEAALVDMEEMAEAAGAGVRFVVFIDRSPDYVSGPVVGIPDFDDAKVIEITGSGAEIVHEAGEVNSGHPQTLAWFLWYGLTNHPSERTAIVLWNHGIGPVEAIGVDESSLLPDGSPDLLDVVQLQQAFQSAYQVAGTDRVDLVVFDACLNGFFELAQAMSPFSRYFLASEQLVQGDGQDYTAFEALNDGTPMDGRDLGLTLLEAFPAHHDPFDPLAAELTLALVDLDAVGRLGTALSSFARAVETDPTVNGPALLRARSATIEFPGPSFGDTVDLVDLGDLLSRLPDSLDPAVLNARNAAYEALRSAVVANVAGPAAEGTTGLSIYLPTSGATYLEEYGSLADPTGWTRMLQTVLFGAPTPAPEVAGGLDLELSPGGWKATLEAADAADAAGSFATFGRSRDDGNTTLLTLLTATIGAGAPDNVQASWSYEYFTLDGQAVTASVQPTADGTFVTVPGVYVGAGGQRTAGLRFRAAVAGGRISEIGDAALVNLDAAAAVVEPTAGDRFIPLRRVADGIEPVGQEQLDSIDLTDFDLSVAEVAPGDRFDAAVAVMSPGGATTVRAASAARP
jgi:hypothetical protein